MQSCMDHSILAIFEDSTLLSEVRRKISVTGNIQQRISSLNPQMSLWLFSVFQGRTGVDDESEKLLTALTEMLDAVEDDDGNLSPFDTLPDTKLLPFPKAFRTSGVGL